MAGPQLRVGAKTTTDELQRFAYSLKDGDRLRGKQVGSEVVIYVKTEHKGIKGQYEKFKSFVREGGASHKRGLVKSAVDGVLQRAGKDVDKAVLSASREALNKGMRRDMKGLSLQAVVADLPRSQPETAPPAQTEASHAASTLADKIVGSAQEETSPVSSRPGTTGTSDGWEEISLDEGAKPLPRLPASELDGIGEQLGQDLKALDQNAKDRLLVGGSQGLPERITEQALGKLGPIPTRDREAVETQSKSVANKALAMIADGYINSANEMVLDTSTQTLQRHVGEGGFGTVDLFKDESTGEETILKSPKAQMSDKAASALLNEASVHRLVSGNDNIVAFKGLVVSPEGKTGIAMENMANGDAGDLRNFLSGNYQSSVPFSPQDRRDVAIVFTAKIGDALLHMKQCGVVHSDLKPENAFINAQGQIKLGDFGVSGKEADFIFANVIKQRGPDDYVSPEYWQQDEALLDHEQNFSQRIESRTEAVNDRFKSSKLSDENRQILLSGVANHEGLVRDYGFGGNLANKNDSWGLGASTFSLVYGHSPIEKMSYGDKVGFSQNADLTMIDGQCPPGGTPRPGYMHASSGDPDLDDLLNKLLPSGSREPLPLEELSRHPAMSKLSKPASEVEGQIARLTSQPHRPANNAGYSADFIAMMSEAEDLQA